MFDTRPHTATPKQIRAIQEIRQALQKEPISSLERLSQAAAAVLLQDLTAKYRRIHG